MAMTVIAEGLDWNRWEVPEAEPTQTASFSAFGTAPEEEKTPGAPVWVMDLPEDPTAAGQKLDAMQAQLETAQAALEDIPGRLESLEEQVTSEAKGGISFEAAAALPPLESELLASLQQIETGPQAMTYGLLPFERFNLEEAQREFLAAQQKLLHLFAYLVWVETRIQGELVGRTSVGWGGDADTLYRDGVTLEQVGLHRRNLNLALKSRLTMLRMLTISASGAAKIAVLVTTPGGALLALPVVWKYVNQLLKELKD